MTLAWTLFCAYLLGTAWLGWLGYRRTRDFASFAIGRGDLSALVVGITLAAATASAATFIINPGFVYVDGLSAWIHMVPGLGIGFILMLTVLSFRFRRIGEQAGALTMPDWIGKRYGSDGFAMYFAAVNLLSFAFVVLLVGGISIVMQRLLGVSNLTALLITLSFVTGYVFIGGTYAHVLTNLLQGALMIAVTLLILGATAWQLLAEPASLSQIEAQDPALLGWLNSDGALFNDVFSIYFAGLFVGMTVVCQPHIVTKALYVRSDRAVRNYIIVFSLVFGLFLLLASAGLFAHAVVSPADLIDPASGAFRQDLVMTVYLQTLFPPWVFTVISVILVAAAMSTLDGLLVAISTITANDLLLKLIQRFGGTQRSREAQMKLAMRLGHIVLVVVAAAALAVNLDPPPLLGIFGQVGVYGMALAAVPPLLLGVSFERAPIWLAWSTSALGCATHFLLYFYGEALWPGTLTFANPGVTASLGLLAGLLPALLVAGVMAQAASRRSAR